MDVFVVPVGPDRYELYSEVADEPTDSDTGAGLFGGLRHRFNVMLRAAETRSLEGGSLGTHGTWRARLQERLIRWVADRVSEQRLLWSLRRAKAATLVFPEDLRFDQAMTLVLARLTRERQRHRSWFWVDLTGLVASALVMPIPGPNLIAYYFAFRVVGRSLSMAGASQGLWRTTWTGRPCSPLAELRAAVALEPGARRARLHDIGDRLSLRHLATFVERVAFTRA